MTETPPFSAADFAVPLRRGRANIIAVESGGDLAGYAVCLYKTEKGSGYTVAGVADMQVAEDSPEHVGALLAGAFCAARRQGAAILQVTGFCNWKRLVLEEYRPRPMTPGANWPYFCKARDPIMRTVLRQPDSWDPCAYDGDSALACL